MPADLCTPAPPLYTPMSYFTLPHTTEKWKQSVSDIDVEPSTAIYWSADLQRVRGVNVKHRS